MAPRPQHDTPGYFRLVTRLLKPFPNFDFVFIRPVRARAAALVGLKPGSRVLDLGCGLGGSFPYLRDAVGGSGEVVGVEISEQVAANAERRIAVNGWTNVHVVCAPAADVVLTGTFDGALMFGAPDVYGSEAALKNIFSFLTPGARVVFFGAKTTRRRGGWVLNGALRAVFSKASFDTTPIPDDEPWRVISSYVNDIVVQEYFLGWMFLASATVRLERRVLTR